MLKQITPLSILLVSLLAVVPGARPSGAAPMLALEGFSGLHNHG